MIITILDGGMGDELRARLPEPVGPLWATRALLDAPEMVVALHREYIDAGAQIIITSSYSTIPSYLQAEGLENEFEFYTSLAGKLARQAADESGKVVTVAGSIPPLQQSYRPDLVMPAAEASPIYEKLVKALLPHVDMFICETMSSADEALNAATQAVLHGGGKPVYVSWTLNETPDAGLRSGESIERAFEKVSQLDIAGFLFNCTHPEAIEAGLRTLRPLTDKPLGCYANKLARVPIGWTLDPETSSGRRNDIDEDYFIRISKRCIEAGATIIGGCCGITPGYIRALTESV